MRFIIYGAGGIGCVLGGHLFRAGNEVALVGNARHVDAINTSGLRLVTGDEPFTLRIPAFKLAEELAPFRDDDVVLLCAKSQHTLKCLGQLRTAGAPHTLPIFCCQNSIWNEPLATRVFDHVYGVMIMIPAIFLSPGEVINPISERYGFIDIGCYPRGVDALCERVADALTRAGFSARSHPDVMKPKAAKCLTNLGNAFEALTDGNPMPQAAPADARRRVAQGKGDAHTFLQATRAEAMQVWSAAGIEWEDPKEFQQRAKERYGVRKIPAGYEQLSKHSSSWQSLARGTGNIEAEQLNGDVVRLGALLGIATPYNALLWRVADEVARSHAAPGKYSADDLMRMINDT